MEEESIVIDSWPSDISVDGDLKVRSDVYFRDIIELKTKKPYLIFLHSVECVIGEWNKDKGEYGVRIYFVSGKDIWIGGAAAKGFLQSISYDRGKFDDRVKAGPPTV